MTLPRPEQLLSVARAHRPTPPAAGGLVFASDMAGLSQAYRLDGPDRFPVRLAPGQDRTLPVTETPLGLLVRQDTGGNETWQLALVGAGGALRTVTRDPRAIHRNVRLAPDGRRAGLAHNPDGRSDWALGVIDLETGDIEPWLERDGYLSWLGWSPDGRLAAIASATHTHRNRAYLLEQGGEPQPLLPDALFVPTVAWAGRRLLALTDLEREFVGLVEVDPDDPTRIRRRLVDEGHDVLAAVPDPAGRRVAVVVNAGASDSLPSLDLETGLEQQRPPLPAGLVYSDNTSETGDQVAWALDGERLLVAWESSTAPSEIYEVLSGTRWTRASGDPLPGLRTPSPVSFR